MLLTFTESFRIPYIIKRISHLSFYLNIWYPFPVLCHDATSSMLLWYFTFLSPSWFLNTFQFTYRNFVCNPRLCLSFRKLFHVLSTLNPSKYPHMFPYGLFTASKRSAISLPSGVFLYTGRLHIYPSRRIWFVFAPSGSSSINSISLANTDSTSRFFNSSCRL